MIEDQMLRESVYLLTFRTQIPPDVCTNSLTFIPKILARQSQLSNKVV